MQTIRLWILICVNQEFGCQTAHSFVFSDNREAIAARDSADINCDGWHTLHAHFLDDWPDSEH